jgi:hypothetical protein
MAHSSKKLEPPKAYFKHCSKLPFPGTRIVQPLFSNPQPFVNLANFAQGCIALVLEESANHDIALSSAKS